MITGLWDKIWLCHQFEYIKKKGGRGWPYLYILQGCGIVMPDSYIEPAGQVDFPG